jgi:preprotein translocase subunit YajC
MQSSLEVGDEVMLTSGIFGTVRSLDEAAAQVEIANGVTIRVARGAVGQVVAEGPAGRSATDDAEAPEEN